LLLSRPQIRTSPTASRAAATTLDIAQRFLCAELLDRQLALMMAGPVAFTLAIAIDQLWKSTTTVVWEIGVGIFGLSNTKRIS
jgi:hypothetical protein